MELFIFINISRVLSYCIRTSLGLFVAKIACITIKKGEEFPFPALARLP